MTEVWEPNVAALYLRGGGSFVIDKHNASLPRTLSLANAKGPALVKSPVLNVSVVDGGGLFENLCVIVYGRGQGATFPVLLSGLHFHRCTVDVRGTKLQAVNITMSDVPVALTMTRTEAVFTNLAMHDVAGGGAIVAKGASITINSAAFVRCSTAGSGGAIYLKALPREVLAGAKSPSTLTITDATFTHCTASGSGGAVFIDAAIGSFVRTNFSNCSAAQGGGAVWAGGIAIHHDPSNNDGVGTVTGAQLQVVDASFVDNVATQGNGGAVALVGTRSTHASGANGVLEATVFAAMHIRDSSFTSNFAPQGAGGALSMLRSHPMPNTHFSSLTFNGNRAANGGAVAVLATSQWISSDCSFSNNSASSAGVVNAAACPIAAAFVADSSRAAAGLGGAVYASAGSVVFDAAANFSHNIASCNGGAIAGQASNLTLNGARLCDNAAGNSGGGVYATESSVGGQELAVVITNTTFGSNIAQMNGGGLAAINPEQGPEHRVALQVTLQALQFDDNTAVARGGGAVFSDMPISCFNCRYTGGSAVYGHQMATQARALLLVDANAIADTPQHPGLAIGPETPTIVLLDGYSQKVTTPTAAVVRVKHGTHDGAGLVATAGFSNGTAVFGGLSLTGQVPATHTLVFTAGPGIKPTNVTVRLMPCPSGYRYSVSSGSCIGCLTGTYSAGDGWLACLPCPYGAACPGVDPVTNLRGFYGITSTQLAPTNATWSPADGHPLTMAACPANYCGYVATSTARPSTTACLHGRVGVLCGSCPANSSATVDSTSCRPNSDCNDVWWFVPAWAAFAIAFTAYLVWWQPKSSSGLLEVTAYFYQLVAVVSMQDATAHVELGVERVVEGIFSLRASSGASESMGGVCPFPMSTVHLTVFQYLLPAVAAALLIISVALGWCCIFTRLLCCTRLNEPGAALYQGLLQGELDAERAQRVRYKRWCRRRCCCCHRCAALCSKLPPFQRNPMQARLAGAAVHLVLYTYSHVIATTILLVHCVTIDGVDRLFISADVVCYTGWQVGLMFGLSILGTFPLAVPFIVRALRRANSSSSPAAPQRSAHVGVQAWGCLPRAHLHLQGRLEPRRVGRVADGAAPVPHRCCLHVGILQPSTAPGGASGNVPRFPLLPPAGAALRPPPH